MFTVETKNLTKVFKKDGVKAVYTASFKVKKGEVFGLIGPNGAGKTTTIQMLTTLLKPTSGSAKIAGFDTVKESKKVRQNIGLVFQESILDEDLTAYDNLALHAMFYRINKNEIKKKSEELLELVGLTDKTKAKVRTFSGGMKRRLEIARGLVHKPEVLFLDEPTVGLDPKTRRKIWDYIQKLSALEGLTIILTTHYLEEIDALCDRVAIMHKGKIEALDTPENLKSSLGGDLVELKLSDPDCGVRQKLEEEPYVKKIASKNCKKLEVTLDNGEQNAAKIIEIVNELPTKILSFNLRKPTLDDVFLNYTGERIED